MIAALFLLVTTLSGDLQFANSYYADELPENAAPKWVMKGNAGNAAAADGLLGVNSEGTGKRQFYVLDTASGAWDMSNGLATVEFRMKCASDDPEDEVFRVQLSDGKQMWRVNFYNGRCNGSAVKTGDWDTYRLTLKDGKMQVSSEKLGVIARDIAPSPLEDTAALLFGTFKASPKFATRSWDLDFLRWSNESVE